MIFLNDPAGETLYNGVEWTRLTGQDRSLSIGRGWLERIHPHDRNLVEDIHSRGIENGSEYSMRYRLLRSDDSARWVVAGARPTLRASDYAVLGFLGTMTILTDVPTDAIKAYGNIERFVPPPAVSSSNDHLEGIADHMLLAAALIEETQLMDALPGVRHSLYQVGRAIAARNQRRQQFN